ncbi:putative reverse transcriptase zinc-binding domain-containing protein [Rosa chinensis]|uniref:Putative reverse transcriptase zinc-binding domain-containing protein n=1 Tax=Rosa chinensis TaxID=74649 RepID=A0A2P6PAC7_ROSCH|nr:putative reverse transcriptase zinc-binding domain-containing protein [Rosa chinensis]
MLYPQLVNSLIDWDLHTWSLDQIAHLLLPSQLRLITSIQIGDGQGSDRLIWPWSRNGYCSVKFGYHWIHSNRHKAITCSKHTSHIGEKFVWKLVWKIDTLTKVKNFLWRAISGAIPTLLNLHRRKVCPSPICPICGEFEESIEHSLLLCSWVDLVWFGSPLGLRLDKKSVTTLDSWLSSINNCTTTGTEKERLLTWISFLCWKIWTARCDFIYRWEALSPQKVICDGVKLANEFWGARSLCNTT